MIEKHQVPLGSDWTLFIYAPSNFFIPNELYLISSEADSILYQEALLAILQQCTELVVKKWGDLLDKFDEESRQIKSMTIASFMRPNAFVDLLYDTAYVPRSRFYFWAIECLRAFEKNIEENLCEISDFRRSIVQSVVKSRTALNRQRKNIRQLDKSIEQACKSLEDIKVNFQNAREVVQLRLDNVSSPFVISSTSIIRS